MSVPVDIFFENMDDFFDYRSTIYQVSPQTVKSNRTDLSLFKDFLKTTDHDTISGPAVIDFQYYLKEDRQNCGASINRKLFALRSYANFLKLFDVPSARKLPFKDVLKIRSGYRNRPCALTVQQIQGIFSYVDKSTVLGVRDYAVYALMYQLGLRVGEVYLLNLADLDFANSRITVMGKGRRPRTLHMNKELIEIIADYLAVRDRIFNSDRKDALFVSKKGNRLAIRTMEENLKNVVDKMDLKVPFNVSCHTLRHSLASHLNDNEVDILVIQSILGHSSTRSTEPYIHPSADRVRRALEKLPVVKHVKELIDTGVLKLDFQKSFKVKRE